MATDRSTASELSSRFLAELADMKLAGDWSERLEEIAQSVAELDFDADASQPTVHRQQVEATADMMQKLYGSNAERRAELLERRLGGSFSKLVRVELQRRERLARRSDT